MKNKLNYTTLAFIQEAHAGQKYGDMPYFFHPVEVAELALELIDRAGSTIWISSKKFADKKRLEDDTSEVSLMHDVIEDTHYTRAVLEQRFPSNRLDSIELVTKDETLDYRGNIQRIVDSKDLPAMFTKLADNIVNRRGDKTGWNQERVAQLNDRYDMSIEMLLKAFKDLGWKINIKGLL